MYVKLLLFYIFFIFITFIFYPLLLLLLLLLEHEDERGMSKIASRTRYVIKIN